MELIKISQTKLKIMLSAEDVKKYEFESGGSSDISGRAAFRNILKEARDRCGFDAVCDRVFVQYYPEKGGGCEMFVTKLADNASGTDGARDRQQNGRKFMVSSGGITERYDSGYIIYSFSAVSELLLTCKSLRAARYSGESRVYRIVDKCRYYLVLTSETYFAAENNGVKCENSYYYVLAEHGELICSEAVEKLGVLA